ncbi:3'-5' exonuclease [Falsiroseomonas sp. HW251]|uniref:3'-5' exonuclease n=1 Tax=Falsiroseomonas sp. HW251 TaxID=3390998 RepID=UPI003D317713
MLPHWLRRLFYRATLGNHDYKFLFGRPPLDEAVALDCETTGLDPRVDDIIAVAAVRIAGGRILTSERYEAIVAADARPEADTIKVHGIRRSDVAGGRPMHEVLPELLRFIGPRPLVGYYIAFDVRMIDKYALRQIQAKLPNPTIEVSELYYERKYGNAPPGTEVDLRFASLLADLGIPELEQHVAINDALMAAMAWLQLRDMKARGVRIGRDRSRTLLAPTGG